MNLPADLLEGLPEASGQSMTEAVRTALAEYRHSLACDKLLALRGKVKFGATWQELVGKYDDE